MKYLKYFESNDASSFKIEDLRLKLISIIDMLNYLWSNNMGDTLNNFTGECSILFSGDPLSIRNGWSINDSIPPYNLDIESLLSVLKHKEYGREDKLERIEKLYKLSKSERFKDSKSEIREKLSPVLNYEIFGGRMIEKFKIDQYYNWLQKPCFSIKIELHNDLFEVDSTARSQRIKNKEIIKSLESDFNRYRDIIESEIKKLHINYKVNIHDYSYSKDFFSLMILLESS